jgi:nucleoside-diphosphate-sugar epimerase
MTTVGVTGASGFLGGALVPALAAAGHELRLIDDHSGPMRVDHPDHPVATGDFTTAEGLRLLEGSDVVLHLGALSGVVICAEQPERTARINVDGTRTLVAWARSRAVPIAFASSFAVVGIPAHLPIREDTPPNPPHAYARQKAEGEGIVRSLGAEGGPGAAVLRMSNLYGRYLVGGRPIAKGNVLNLFATQARSGRLMVFAPGTQRRDYIHLEDVVAHWLAAVGYLTSRRGGARTFNVASGEGATVLELAGMVRDHHAKLFPSRKALEVEVVENPRANVEILHPEFEVDRRWTEKELGVQCRHHLATSIDEILKAEDSAPTDPPPAHLVAEKRN